MINDVVSIRNCKRIAVMGGTFDPVHYGHLVTAEAVRDEFSIEKVVFIPAGKPAFKQNSYVTSSEHRYLMTVLATTSNPYFEVSKMEIDRAGITYTVDTIEELRLYCRKDAEIFFITGADAVNDILSWKDSERLLNMCNFVAVSRPGYDRRKLMEKILELEKKTAVKLYFMEVPSLAISSSDIRERVRTKKSIKYLLPETVESYIRNFDLYKESDLDDLITNYLKASLSENRFKHTLGVAAEAKTLAKTFGEDEKKAYTAGLLHDIAKEYTDTEARFLCKKYNIEIDEIMEKEMYLAHSFIGAELARDFFGIEDPEILNSIRYHTTGRKNMCPLEKIIYLADAIEPNRRQYPELNKLRSLAYENLDEAMILGLKTTIIYAESKNLEIHKLSKKALKYFKKIKEDTNGNK